MCQADAHSDLPLPTAYILITIGLIVSADLAFFSFLGLIILLYFLSHGAVCHSRLIPTYSKALFKLSTVGSGAFPVAAANIWNTLPHNVISALAFDSFRGDI